MPGVTSRADVRTEAPDRYAKQLVSHLARKLTFVGDATTWAASIGAGAGQVVVGDGVLTLTATGPDEESLGLVEQVLGSHLKRFAQRHQLTVAWHRSS